MPPVGPIVDARRPRPSADVRAARRCRARRGPPGTCRVGGDRARPRAVLDLEAARRARRGAGRCRGRASRRRSSVAHVGVERASSASAAAQMQRDLEPAAEQRLGHLDPDVAGAHDDGVLRLLLVDDAAQPRCRRRGSARRRRPAASMPGSGGRTGVAPVAITSWSYGSTVSARPRARRGRARSTVCARGVDRDDLVAHAHVDALARGAPRATARRARRRRARGRRRGTGCRTRSTTCAAPFERDDLELVHRRGAGARRPPRSSPPRHRR